MGARMQIPPHERVDRRLQAQDTGYATPCRIYQGYVSSRGYPQTNVGSSVDGSRRMVAVHRIAYEHAYGPVPDGLVLDHLCRQKACCEVTHLEAVTQAENIRRGIRGVLTTHCPAGHEYTPENTAVYRGSRNCRACSAARHATDVEPRAHARVGAR